MDKLDRQREKDRFLSDKSQEKLGVWLAGGTMLIAIIVIVSTLIGHPVA